MAVRAARLVGRRNSLGSIGSPQTLPFGREFATLSAKTPTVPVTKSVENGLRDDNIVEIYSKPGCNLTEKYAQTLNENGIEVTQYLLGIDVDATDILKRAGVADTEAPLVFVNGQFSTPLKSRASTSPNIIPSTGSLPYGRSFARMLHTHVGPSNEPPASRSMARDFSRLSDARMANENPREDTQGAVSTSTCFQFNSVASREQANKWLKEKQFARAEKEYSKLIRNDAGTYTTYSNRATARFFQNKFELAAQDAKTVIEMEPSHVKGYLRLSSCLRAQKRFKDALLAIDEAISSPVIEAGGESEKHLSNEQEAIKREIEAHDDRGFGYFFPEDGDPNVAWMLMKKNQTVDKVDVSTLSSELKDHSKLRVVCLSDTHGRHKALGEIPDGDVLVCAGDFTETGSLQEVADFSAWLKEQPHKHKIVIAGNHDVTFEPGTYMDSWDRYHKVLQDPIVAKRTLESSGCVYLEDSSFEVEGIKFFGTPHQPEFNNWAFNSKRGSECRVKWDQIPADTDVLISHGPPLGHGDVLDKKKKAGCVDLLHSVQQVVRPSLHIFGHVHEGYGATTDGETVYVNASVTSDDEWLMNPCIVVDVDKK
jgi:Icc-related predicted phosphoesterase/glutaredoxin